MKPNVITIICLCSLSLSATEHTQALTYLNQLRNGTGMISFALDANLNTAAQNHANYMLSNSVFGHYETSGNTDYTGYKPSDRGEAAGYFSSVYGENISAGNADMTIAIDSLFTAIYHRLGFLTMDKLDLGVGFFYDNSYPYHSAHVFNMATDTGTSPR